MHTPKITIIIPTYNVESYIARCLDSCINQTLHDIEILVIDDCGSDDSIKIAQSYADKDSRIRIIHNEKNLGTFQTRIQGIKHAKGSYIAFLDADDYLHLQACEALHRHTTLHNADILHFKAHYPANPNTPLLAKLTHYIRYALPTRFSKAPLYNEQIAYNFFLDSKQFPKFTLWDKCYNTTLLRQVCKCFTDSSFTPIVADDMLFFLAIVAIAKSYISIDKRLYFYCLNAQSSMQAPSKKQRRIDSFAYVANALHSLRLDSSLLPKIAETMSKNLAALIILESRLSRMHGGGGYSRISTQYCIAFYGYATILARFFTLYANDRDSSSAYATCGIRAYPSAQDSKIYALYPLTILALLHIVITILESLPYLYSCAYLYPKPRQSQALNTHCHTEPLGEVSYIKSSQETNQDISPFSKAQYDKHSTTSLEKTDSKKTQTNRHTDKLKQSKVSSISQNFIQAYLRSIGGYYA